MTGSCQMHCRALNQVPPRYGWSQSSRSLLFLTVSHFPIHLRPLWIKQEEDRERGSPHTRLSFEGSAKLPLITKTFPIKTNQAQEYVGKNVSRQSCRTHHCAMFDSRSLRLVAPITRRGHLQTRPQFSGVRSVSLLSRSSFTRH
jgi:hypothetical protein